MKAVMISIQPKWVEKIANGEKAIEVRKTQPKLKTPFKCYIYMTQGKVKDLGTYSEWIYENRMKVIGEFVCDNIHIHIPLGLRGFEENKATLTQTCLTNDDLNKYGGLKSLYGWHISDLNIYDEPKELSEFSKSSCKDAYFQHNEYEGEWFCNAVEFGDCKYKDCPKCSGENNEHEDFAYCLCGGKKPIARPPQSWCYVEEVEE